VCVCGLRYPACNTHVLYCHLWSVQLYDIFPHYLKNGTIFDKKTIEHKICFFLFSLQLLSEKILSLRRIERDSVSMYRCLNVKCPLFFSDLNEPWIFSTDFSKNTQISNSRKSAQWVPSCSMRTDGQTERQTDRQNEAKSLFFQVRQPRCVPMVIQIYDYKI